MSTSSDIATKAERELLKAIRELLGPICSATANVALSAVLQQAHVHLGQLLRAAAIAGLSEADSEAVGRRIDHALRSVLKASVQGPSFTVARREDGRLSIDCSIDLSAISVAYVGDYSTNRTGFKGAPVLHRFRATAEFPSLEIVLPPAQLLVNNVQQATRQTITNNEAGEITEIVTRPIEA
jgi:hypothetical protein